MTSKHTTLATGGRVVIPAAMRRQLGLEIGDEVMIDLEGDALRLRSVHSAIKQAQANVRQYVDKNVCLSEQLIADRRQEAARE